MVNGSVAGCSTAEPKVGYTKLAVLSVSRNLLIVTFMTERLLTKFGASSPTSTSVGLLNSIDGGIRAASFCICKNKDTDQLCGKCTADQCLCFRFMDSSIPLLHISRISSL